MYCNRDVCCICIYIYIDLYIYIKYIYTFIYIYICHTILVMKKWLIINKVFSWGVMIMMSTYFFYNTQYFQRHSVMSMFLWPRASQCSRKCNMAIVVYFLHLVSVWWFSSEFTELTFCLSIAWPALLFLPSLTLYIPTSAIQADD